MKNQPPERHPWKNSPFFQQPASGATECVAHRRRVWDVHDLDPLCAPVSGIGKCIWAKRFKARASHCLDALARRLCRNTRGQRSLRQKGSKPSRAPFPAEAQNWPVRWNQHGSYTQLASPAPPPSPSFPPLGTRIVPPLLVLPQLDHPHAPPSPARDGLLPLEPRTPVLPPAVIASRGNAGIHPARLTQRPQAAALHALPRPRTAPPNSRSVWSALGACQTFSRKDDCELNNRGARRVYQGNMAQRFKTIDRNSPFLLPPDLRDWVAQDDLVHFVIHAVERLPLSASAVNSKGCGDEQ